MLLAWSTREQLYCVYDTGAVDVCVLFPCTPSCSHARSLTSVPPPLPPPTPAAAATTSTASPAPGNLLSYLTKRS
jgi:hypothetical protein